MNQLQYNTGAFRHARAQSTHSPQQRIFGIIFAATVEVGIVYALMVSLGVAPPPRIPKDLVVVNVPALPSKPEDPIAAPPPIEKPPVEITIPQDIQLVYVPPVTLKTITIPAQPPVLPPLTREASVTPPPAPVFTPARAVVATHTTPEYPPVARRLGQQGTLRLKLVVTEQGTVSDAVLVNSSGSDYLDKAAIDWVKKFWRYEPARQGTRAVRAEVQAVVEFKLQ